MKIGKNEPPPSLDIKNKFNEFLAKKINTFFLNECRNIMDEHILYVSYKNSDEYPTMDQIKEKKFLVWAERKEVDNSEKIEIKKYLFGYFLKHEKDGIKFCFKAILVVLFLALGFILSMAWIFNWLDIFNKLALFTIDMLISSFAIYILYTMYNLSYSLKRDQDDIKIYTYNKEIEEETIGFKNINQENIQKCIIQYEEYTLNVSQYLPILISGFFVLLITFSFYTSSLIETELSDEKIIQRTNND